MSLSVEDILDDLAKLQQSQSSSSASATHPILSLGNSLLPPNLQRERRAEVGKQETIRLASSVGASDTLEEALSNSSRSQADALHLSSVYLESTRQILDLNQEREKQESAKGQKEVTVSLFDDLHRRVAKLQSSNEGFMKRLQDVRQVIVGGQDK